MPGAGRVVVETQFVTPALHTRLWGSVRDLAGDGPDCLGGEMVVAVVAVLAANAPTFGQVGAWVTDAWLGRVRDAERGVVRTSGGPLGLASCTRVPLLLWLRPVRACAALRHCLLLHWRACAPPPGAGGWLITLTSALPPTWQGFEGDEAGL